MHIGNVRLPNVIEKGIIVIVKIPRYNFPMRPKAQVCKIACYYTVLPRSLDTFQCRTYSANFPLSGEHSLPDIAACDNGTGKFKHNHVSHPTGSQYTWVESSNVDKLPC